MAPSKLGRVGYRRFDSQGNNSRESGNRLTSQVGWIRGPWPGYEPDLSPAQATPGSATTVDSLIDREGTLTHQNGFDRVGPATLPLGDTTPPASSAAAEPIVCIAEGRTKATQAIRRYAITSNTTASGYGHFYELVAGTWTHRAFNATSGGNGYTGDSGDPGATLADSAHYTTADYTVFAGGQGNLLYRFPGLTIANEFEALAGLGSLTTLAANSILFSEERLHVFGTAEGGTFYPTRWRWTSKGASGQFDPTLTGAGFVEVGELGGEALAIRNIGTKIALYTTQGVQFARRTGQTTDPFAKDYTCYDRGALSTQSVVNVGSGVHFGIFTDGWFLLRYDGVWEERGLTDKGYHKWQREFYGTLDWANKKRIICAFDENNSWVYIAFPQAGSSENGPSTVWVYDVLHDTCWPAPNWQYKPNVFGVLTEEASVGATWGSLTSPWSSGSASWGRYESQTGQRRILHGTGGQVGAAGCGLVFVHNPASVEQDGVLPNYSYKTHYLVGDRPDLHKKVEALHVQYTRVQADNGTEPTPISLAVENENGRLVVGSVDHTKGTPTTQQTDFASPGVVSGLQHRFTVSGIAPIKISGLGIQVQQTPSADRKEGSV